MKEVLLSGLNPDTEENQQSACENINRRKLCENQECIDDHELAIHIEKLLYKASSGLPVVNRNAELRYHLLGEEPGLAT